MFRNSVDAFLYLLDGREQVDRGKQSHNVAAIEVGMKCMANGIKRCGVQVLYDDGVRYGIEAYDREADELYKEAKMWSRNREAPLQVVS